jgi:hypothetical protein
VLFRRAGSTAEALDGSRDTWMWWEPLDGCAAAADLYGAERGLPMPSEIGRALALDASRSNIYFIGTKAMFLTVLYI